MFLTITLNPSVDKICRTPKIINGDTNRIEVCDILAAGKGIDVAKALRLLGKDVTVAGFLGGSAIPIFKKLFTDTGMNDAFTIINGETRTNLHIIDNENDRTEFLEGGPTVTAQEWASFYKKIEQIAGNYEAVAVCGSAPYGITQDMYASLLAMLRKKCSILAVDTSGELLNTAINQRVDFIKPNQLEIAQLMGKSSASLKSVTDYCINLVKQGPKSILVSLGGEGSMLVNSEGVIHAVAPKVNVKSTLGCGDTMVASALVSMAEGDSSEQLIKKASTLASANAASIKTADFDIELYKSLLSSCTVIKW